MIKVESPYSSDDESVYSYEAFSDAEKHSLDDEYEMQQELEYMEETMKERLVVNIKNNEIQEKPSVNINLSIPEKNPWGVVAKEVSLSFTDIMKEEKKQTELEKQKHIVEKKKMEENKNKPKLLSGLKSMKDLKFNFRRRKVNQKV
jgi:RecA/RadA recombinase